MADIDAVERLLCERYNVRALDAGELSDGIEQARKGDASALRAALEARELYRWQSPIFAALNAPDQAEAPAEGEDEEAVRDLQDLTVAELRALAAERDIDLTGVQLKADIVAAIELAGEEDDEGE